MVIRERVSYKGIRDLLGGLLEQDLHAKRVNSLCDATLGVLHSGSLAICAIGQGLAAARSLKPKHAIKQVDRLLSNTAISVDDILVRWVPFVIGARSSIVVAMDWTDFDADNQATIMLALISDHGRSTPLVWLTVDKSTLKERRGFYEHRVLVRLAELLPAGVKVCIVADRGFGDQKLYKMLTEELYFDYVIRFRGNITVTSATGETRTAADWVQAGGRARVLRGAEVTADRYRVGSVVCVQDPDMKQAWCLAASSTDATAKQLTGLYGRRWGIEIDQAWRLSRLYRVRRARHDDWRRPTTPWRGSCASQLKGGNHGIIGVHQFERRALVANRSTAQTSLLDPAVEGRFWHSEMPSQFGNRPLLGLTFNDHRSPFVPNDFDFAEETLNHQRGECVTSLRWSPTFLVEDFRDRCMALPSTPQLGCTGGQLVVSAELVETSNRSNQLVRGLVATVPMTAHADLLRAVDDFNQHPFEQQANQGLSLFLSGGCPDAG